MIHMPVRITLGRAVALIVAGGVLVSAGIAITAVRQSLTSPAKEWDPTPPPTKTVPDVVGQPYVFAESTLQESGFAWKVEGKVAGWAEAVVERQDPVGGTKLVDTGAPLVKLRLTEPEETQGGTPENASPYPGTRIIYPAGSTQTTSTDSAATKTTIATVTEPVAKPKATKPKATKPKAKAKKPKSNLRPPAFVVEGANPEPLDEIPLPQRARQLDRWLDSHRQKSQANANHWLYQHAWIVTGAKFGWWHGEQALEILIRVDERVQELWGVGAQSEAEARAALEFVRARQSG